MNSNFKLISCIYFFFLFLSMKNQAQFMDCIDETRVQPTFQCNQPMFDPVCGCDLYTYRNACEAYFRFGVTYWDGGVCAGFFMDIHPNPVTNMTPMIVRVQFQDFVFGRINLRIVDMYGKPVYQSLMSGINRFEWSLDLLSIKNGVYLLIAEGDNGQVWVHRFIKA